MVNVMLHTRLEAYKLRSPLTELATGRAMAAWINSQIRESVLQFDADGPARAQFFEHGVIMWRIAPGHLREVKTERRGSKRVRL